MLFAPLCSLSCGTDDPSEAFSRVEEFMDYIQQSGENLSDDDVSIHFVSTSLPRMVIGLLKRG